MLLTYLEDRPTAYLNKIAQFLWDDCNIIVLISLIQRALKHNRWSRKVVQRRAQERSKDLRTAQKGRQCIQDSNRLIFINKSGTNKRTSYRKFGQSPINLPAINIVLIKRLERWSILPQYIPSYIVLVLDNALIYKS